MLKTKSARTLDGDKSVGVLFVLRERWCVIEIKALSAKEKKFCERFLETGEKGKSAEYAGYKSPSVAASKLLSRSEVIDYIHKLQAALCRELHIDRDWAVIRAMEVYERCMQVKPVLQWDYEEHKMVETGEYMFDSKGAIKALELINKLLGLDNSQAVNNDSVIIVDDMGGGGN